jgi:hypothetical protein
VGPDSNGHYIAEYQGSFLFIDRQGTLLFAEDWDNNNSQEINGIRVSLFKGIQGPDKNGNYLTQYDDVYDDIAHGFISQDGMLKFLDLDQISPIDKFGNYQTKKGDSEGLINKYGNELFLGKYSSVTLDLHNNYLCGQENGWQLYFPSSDTFSKQYSNISPSESSYLVQQDDLFSLLSLQ